MKAVSDTTSFFRKLLLKAAPVAAFSTVFLSVNVSINAATVAVYEGGEITARDLFKKFPAEYYRLRKARYDLYYNLAIHLLEEKVLSLEEKATGKSRSDLLSSFVNSRINIDEKEIRQQYQNSSSWQVYDYEKIRPLLKEEIREEQAGELEVQYIKSLFKKYNARIILKEPARQQSRVSADDDPSWGDSSSPVQIIEFSDFECTYCGRMQRINRRIRAEYSDSIHWVFRDFPLPFHGKAMRAHIAANCAAEQNKYSQYQYAAFTASDLKPVDLVKIAEDFNLDLKSFAECTADSDFSKRNEIRADMNDARRAGVSGTPTYFINGRKYTGYMSYGQLKQIIDSELSEAR